MGDRNWDAEIIDSNPDNVSADDQRHHRKDDISSADVDEEDLQRIVEGMSKMHDAAAMQKLNARRLAKAEAELAAEREVL